MGERLKEPCGSNLCLYPKSSQTTKTCLLLELCLGLKSNADNKRWKLKVLAQHKLVEYGNCVDFRFGLTLKSIIWQILIIYLVTLKNGFVEKTKQEKKI